MYWLSIWVREPMPGQDFRFHTFHFGGLRIFLMVKSEQMQGAVHEHVRPVALQRLALLLGLRPYYRRADDHITKRRRLPGRRRRQLGRE